MTTKNNIRRNVWMVLAALFLALGIVSASGTKLTSASGLPSSSPNDLVRKDMHNIAYLYANHRWIATQTNLMPSSSDSIPNYTDRFTSDDPSAILYVSATDNLIHYFFGGTLTKNYMDTNKEITPDGIITSDGPNNSTFLFSIAAADVGDIPSYLDIKQTTQGLLTAFQNAQHPLTNPAVVVEKQGSQWAVIYWTGTTENPIATSYHIRLEQQALNVYSGINAGVAGGENVGVPYAWGLSSGLVATEYDKAIDPNMQDVSLPLHNVASFDEKIAGGYFAGNKWHDDVMIVNNYAAGVDCVGLINNVWRMGGRYPMSKVKDYSFPININTIQTGDILMKDDHVMMFDHFDPVNPNVIWVYEASAIDWKVAYHSHTVGTPAAPDPNNPSAVTLDGGTDLYVPRTYIKNLHLNVVLVLDESGSMSGTYMDTVKKAAESFVSQMHQGDLLGVVGFSDTATPIYPPQEGLVTIGDTSNGRSAEQQAAITAIANHNPAYGATSIGAGLEYAADAIKKFGTPDGIPPSSNNNFNGTPDLFRAVILLSDGGENVSPLYAANPPVVSQDLTNQQIVVHTVGIGGGIDDKLLARIAREHGGDYQWINVPPMSGMAAKGGGDDIPLKGVTEEGGGDNIPLTKGIATEDVGDNQWIKLYRAFDRIREELYGRTAVKSTEGTIAAGATVDDSILVDSAMGSMTVSFFKSGSDLNLTLKQPDGNAIDINDPNVTYTSDPSYDIYTILAPQTGTWTTRVSSATAGEYDLSTSTMDAMDLSVATDKQEYDAGTPIKFTASINDSTSGSLTSGPDYIHGATMQVTVEDPALNQSTFNLYDDGLHEDGGADDGIYAGAFNNASLDGSYNFNVQVSGNNNRDGLPFIREKHLSVLVYAPPVVVSVVRNFENPTSRYSVDFTVTFSEPVTGVDASDFALTTNGLSGAAISGVSGSSSTYTVTVNTGDGNGTLRLDVVDNDTIANGDGYKLGGVGLGNGNFTSGEIYDKIAVVPIVNKLDDTNDGLCDVDCSLREAIASTALGATLPFDAGLSGGTIHLASTLVLSKNITIDGSALATPITISGDTDNNGTADVKVFTVNSGVTATLKGLVIAKGKSAYGGGVSNNGTLTITNSTFSNNSATEYYGGGVENNGTLTITNSTFSNNSARVHGGGVFNDGTLTIINSTFFMNNSSYYGGGVSNNRTLTIANSTLSNNSAGSYGGGICNFNTAIITNSTIANNSANSGSGGGAHNFYGTLTLINNTFSGNSAASAGGIYNNQYGTLNFANTIIANSPTGGDCVNSGTLGTNTKNLVEDGTCSPFLSGDPNLGPLADNGGSTQTMALLAGSRALNTGDNAACAAAPVDNLDQRGIVRPQGATCDIGSYEMEVNPAVPTVQTFITATLLASFDIPITSFTASDDVGVTGYIISESASTPLAGDSGWSAIAPATYTVSAYGNYSLYPWVKDAAGNVSLLYAFPSNVIVTPITAFTISGNTGTGGVTLSYNDGSPKSTTSASDGTYSISIPYNWSGTVTPSLPGYFFIPGSRSYANVTSDRAGEDYSAVFGPTYTPTRTPTKTPTFTRTPTPTRTNTGTSTYTPTNTVPSATFTPTVTDTETPTETPTDTPTFTNTPVDTPTFTATYTSTVTFTPTSVPTLIADDFNEARLGSDWEWYLPVTGPTYSLSANPGNLHLVIPRVANHWTDLDTAPELRLTDMGADDWAIETHFALGDINSSDGYDINLIVGLDRFDQFWLSGTSDQKLLVRRVGEGESASVNTNLPLYLRIEKSSTELKFKYKVDTGNPDLDAGTPWTTLDIRSLDKPVAYVGVMGRNWASGSADAVFDISYFRLERYGSAAPGPYTETVVDNFAGPNLSSEWQWYVPKAGPTYSLSNGFTISLPPWQSYERWGDTDNAPQLRRTDLGDGDWSIETQLMAVTNEDTHYWASLEVGFDQFDQIMVGVNDSGELIMQRTSDQWPDNFEQPILPVHLRLEKHGEEYTVKYRYDTNEAWTATAPHDYPGMPQYVGLIARVYYGGSQQLDITWSSFLLERWPNNPSTPTPIATATYTPTASNTPIPTDTPTDTPTPTNTVPTSTRTFTPTNTVPTSTRTFTPTNTVPTSTRTYTPTNTIPTSTRTYTPTNTVPTSTRTFTPTNTVPTSTRTYTPTNTVPTSTRTFTPTNTVPTPTRTYTPTRTVPTPTRTYTPTRTVPTPTRTYTPTRTVPTSTRTYTPTRTVPTSTRTYTPTRTVPTSTRTYTPTRTASTTIRTFTPFV